MLALWFLEQVDYNRTEKNLSKAEQKKLNLDFSESEEMTGSQIILINRFYDSIDSIGECSLVQQLWYLSSLRIGFFKKDTSLSYFYISYYEQITIEQYS